MIISRTPFRISLFGGGTDLPQWYRQPGRRGAVLGFALNRYCYVSVRELPPFFDYKHRIVWSEIELLNEIEEIHHPAVRAILSQYVSDRRGYEIHHAADLPARSGLGSSSSFTVGLLNALFALYEDNLIKPVLTNMAIRIEQEVIGEAVGSQDQVWAAYGGVNRIEFNYQAVEYIPGTGTAQDFHVIPVGLSLDRLRQLVDSLILVFSGEARYAVEVEARKIAALDQNGRQLLALLDLVDEAEAILLDERRPVTELGELLHMGWLLKQSLAPGVGTARLDAIYDDARAAGAAGGKVLGAGGGGFMLLMVEPQHRTAVLEALRGLVVVPIGVDHEGSKIIVREP